MAGVNKVLLVGRLGKDVELRYMTSGEAVANVSIATSDEWVDKTTKEKCEKVEWTNLVFYRRLAEVVAEYTSKGSLIYVEGKLQTRKWEKDGVTRYTTEVIVNELKLLGSKLNGGEHTEHVNTATGEIPGKHGPAKPAASKGNFDDQFSDDIPF